VKYYKRSVLYFKMTFFPVMTKLQLTFSFDFLPFISNMSVPSFYI